MVGASVRAAGLGAAATMAAAWLTWWLVGGVLDRWSGALTTVAVEDAFVLLAGGAAAAVAAWATWLLACATLTLLGDVVRRDRPRARGGLPGRVAAGLLVAATLGGAPTGPASAAAAPVHVTATVPGTTSVPVGSVVTVPGGTSVRVGSAMPVGTARPVPTDDPGGAEDVPVPGWTPTTAAGPGTATRPVGEVGLVGTAPAAAAPSADDVVVVTAGDTLWDIAARALGGHATDQDVAEAWPRWYAANRAVIGEDPDLILPGQRLVAPTEEVGR